MYQAAIMKTISQWVRKHSRKCTCRLPLDSTKNRQFFQKTLKICCGCKLIQRKFITSRNSSFTMLNYYCPFYNVNLDYTWLRCVKEVSNRNHTNVMSFGYLLLREQIPLFLKLQLIFLVGTCQSMNNNISFSILLSSEK